MEVNQKQAAKDASLQEEKRLEAELAQLNELHLQLRLLRSALPRMLEPLASKQPSPQVAYNAFRKSIDSTNLEIANFRAAITSEEIKKIFQRAADSRQANPKGIKPWRATEDPEWTANKRRKTNAS
ncbi:hypothetical protein B0H63DRAFT_259586 [Podospora didyma]|uniref:Uncharacterized protein n=1 Tax=Podospora didyma TaxID=330526 RepID=A0AAE0N9B7_9PEZI|nr:hypothetical protein B0H63DRAFT_259586 [Podospora didyma]